MHTVRVGLAALAVCCIFSTTAAADQLLINGGFESVQPGSNIPVSWGTTSNVSSSANGFFIGGPDLVTPHSGTRMALMAPGGLGDAELWQTVDLTGYSWATLSFWWRFEAIDYDVADNGLRDALQLYVSNDNPQDPFSELIWEAPINVDPADGYVLSPWMFGSVSGDVSDLVGGLTFTFHLKNASEGGEYVPGSPPYTAGQQTVAFVDDVSLQASVPEPASLVLVLTGLGVLGLVVRRKKG